MAGKYRVRTDLAMENGEKYEKDNVEISGVVIRKSYDRKKDIHTTVVKIESEYGAKLMEKPVGTYITLEAPSLVVPDEGYHREISAELGVPSEEASAAPCGFSIGGGAGQPEYHA